MKLLMLKGLPASGKSTYAKELVKSKGFTRVNKDDLRSMLHDSKWSKGNEKAVLYFRDEMISYTLSHGQNVVIDDTNFNPIHEQRFRDLAKIYNAEFEVKFFDEPLEVCIERDLKRPNSVGEKVIRQMYDQYLKPAPAARPEWDFKLPTAVICDIDGTLAHMKDRGPFEWHKVGSDTIDDEVSALLNMISKSENAPTVVMVSGRDNVCRPETEDWLRNYRIDYQELFMRPEGDMRKDNIVKRELFEKYIDGKYNVFFILDDRDQVVDMWRNELGLKVFQVAEGKF